MKLLLLPVFVFVAVNVNPSTPKTKLILLHYSLYTFPCFSTRLNVGFYQRITVFILQGKVRQIISGRGGLIFLYRFHFFHLYVVSVTD